MVEVLEAVSAEFVAVTRLGMVRRAKDEMAESFRPHLRKVISLRWLAGAE